MEVILTQDIKTLGFKDDIVNVKPGYGRNFLIPQGMAILATSSALKVREENIKQGALKAERVKQEAQDLAERIGDLTVEVAAKAGETGKIFGAVTAIQVADQINANGYQIDRKQVDILDEIKELGEYRAQITLHKEVRHEITVKVVEE